jgi:pimeloyl-ACP methyl ester carboxylesterase
MRRYPALANAVPMKRAKVYTQLLAFRSRSVAIGISALWVSGCTSLTPLRKDHSVDENKDYKVAFIEFGEQGSYQYPPQVTNALSLIQKTDKPLVITYVHGWQNNVGSGDVGKFESLLTRLDRAPAVRQAGFHVVGVYLGWRGKLTPVPILKELSFFNRKATAERLASNYDCYDAIASISEVARKYHGAHQYTVLLGHSFGGLIVERSVAHAINAEIHGHADADRSMPADLMIVVNPASNSILARQMIAALYSRKTERTRPLFVSITSTDDWATGLGFPIGTSFAATTKAFNNVPAPGPKGAMQSERKFYTSTPGHNEMLINHVTLNLQRTITSPQGLPALETNLQHNLSAEVFTLDGANGKLDLWQIKRVGVVDVPYWNVRVDPSIIKDHGDLWNERAEAMMAAIFRMANPRLDPRIKPRATLNRTPDPNRVPAPPRQ